MSRGGQAGLGAAARGREARLAGTAGPQQYTQSAASNYFYVMAR